MIRIKRPEVVLKENIITNEQMGHHTTYELPMKSRLRHNLTTTCDHCHKDITDDTFLGVITEKTQNFLFHRDCYPDTCWDQKIYENGNPSCRECDHPYDRHYDGYEDESDPEGFFFAGCKYCRCDTWKPKDDWKYPKRKKENDD
jgi:hypothetical protein